MVENLINSPTGIAIIAIIGVIVVCIIYKGFVISKRPQRKAEIERLIEDIKDPRGADNALELLGLCLHYSQHYGISLDEMGFEDRHDLTREAEQSLARAKGRKQRQQKEIKFDPDGVPVKIPSP